MDSESDEEEFEAHLHALAGQKLRNFRARINFEPDFFEGTFRLTRVGVQEILDIVGQYLTPETARNRSLSAEEQLLVAIRFYSTDGFYRLVGDAHGVSDPTVCRIVHKVTSLINQKLFRDVVRWPEREADKIAIRKRFFKVAKMPSVCGCIDGTLIPIIRPSEYEEQFVDRKGNHSLNAMMVCGPEMQIYYCNVNRPGATNDARVLRTSSLANKFKSGWRPFPSALLLGDSAYPVSQWLMPPLSLPNPTNQERRYNRAHKKMRRLVECSYGIMKNCFPCLGKLRVKSPKFAAEIVQAVVTLHNLRLRNKPEPVSDDSDPDDDGAELNFFGLEDEAETPAEDNEEPVGHDNERAQGLVRQREIIGTFCAN